MPNGSIDTLKLPVLTAPAELRVLLGVDTPLSGLVVNGSSSDVVTVVLTTSKGILFADPAQGVTVGGGGTNSIWMAGTLADINATLASMVFYSASGSTCSLTITTTDATGRSTGSLTLPIAIRPASSSSADGPVQLSQGTLSLASVHVDALTVDLHASDVSATSPSLILVDTSFGANTLLDIADTSSKISLAPRVAVAGQVELHGRARIAGAATLSLALASALLNRGTITATQSTLQIDGAGQFENDGVLAIEGGTASIAPPVFGSGTIELEDGANLTLSGPVAGTQVISLQGTGDVLQLTAPATMEAVISGFTVGDQIVLTGATIDAIDYKRTDAGLGILSLYDGARTVVSLHLAGAYAPGEFRISQAADAPGGEIDVVLTPASGATAVVSNTSAVFRFFDAVTGTELLTCDVAERDSILFGRSDLVYEGVGLHALPTNLAGASNTVTVYRFFDTAHGTHFFTASSAERDAVLATRPDLVFEPSSAMYEHATEQAADVPVYRFFDIAHGTHFYTADVGERAAIMSTRSDMIGEGIAFYAPAA